VTADGEQTGQDAERTNSRAESLEEFIKGLVQDAEGIKKNHILTFFSYIKIKRRD
jgi:laminin alpha 1/2